MRAADHIVDLGPGAGEHGGKIIFEGSYPELIAGRQRLADRPLSARRTADVASAASGAPSIRKRVLRFFGARAHNLKNIDVAIPLGMMVAVTGVSGSGKSTLVHDVIYRRCEALHKARGAGSAKRRRGDRWSDRRRAKLTCRKVEGAELLTQVVMIDQSPIGRTPRSNPVTYIKAFDIIRALFASTRGGREARLHGRPFLVQHSRRPLRNLPGRRHGDGGDAVPGRRGTGLRRMQGHALQERHSGHPLQRPEHPRSAAADGATRPSRSSHGDAAAGAEAEGAGRRRAGLSAAGPIGDHAFGRRSAARETGRAPGAGDAATGTLFIFDEPTTGLHFDDIAKLLAAFERLIENGGSLLVIEHNLDVIKAADWVIDLGPEGGDRGGYVVADGHAGADRAGAGVVHGPIPAASAGDAGARVEY